MSVCGSSRLTPSITTLPEEGSSSRLRQRSSVDFPEPDGPMTNTSSRSATTRSTPFRTCRAPKCLWMPSASTTGLGKRCRPRESGRPSLLKPHGFPLSRERRLVSAALQRMWSRVVARHAGDAVARRDHAFERIGARRMTEPFLRQLGDGAVLLHAIEHILHLVPQRHAVLAKRCCPVRLRVLELEVGDELRVLTRGVHDG